MDISDNTINDKSNIKSNYLLNIYEEEYYEIIEKEPDHLFRNISTMRFAKWESILYQSEHPSFTMRESDIFKVDLDLKSQHIIKNDCIRTRVKESYLYPNFLNTLEHIITYYCKRKNLIYKQGLNEIFGTILLLKYKLKTLTLLKLYAFCECFIHKFLGNYYFDNDFYALKTSMSLFLILLKYHAPEVYNILDKYLISPEIYSTSWIMTMHASKCRLDIIYQLWDHMLINDDPLLFHFFMVALLKARSEELLITESSCIPLFVTTISITSTEEVDALFNIAIQMRKSTPYSYRILAYKLGFFDRNSNNLKQLFEWYKPDTIEVMPIFPSEILYITYKSQIVCPDEKCSTLMNLRKINIQHKEKNGECLNKIKNINKFLPMHKCEKCYMKVEKDISYILLDLRILENGSFEDENEKIGFLPMMIMVPQNELKLDDFPEVISDRFEPDKGKIHFVFLTSNTDYFKNYENIFYSEIITEEEKWKMMFGVQRKIDKKLIIERKKALKKTNDLLKLKEYDNLKLTLISMLKQNFPFISFVYGGFEEVHNLCFEYDVSLLNHEERDCILCQSKEKIKEEKAKNLFGKIKNIFCKNEVIGDSQLTEEDENSEQTTELWIHKNIINYSEFAKMVSVANKEVFPCILKEMNSEMYEEVKVQLLFLIFEKEQMIKMFKLEKQKLDSNMFEEMKREPQLSLFLELSLQDITEISYERNDKNLLIIKYYLNNNKKSDEKKKKESLRENRISLDLSTKETCKKIVSVLKKIYK